MNNKQVLAAIVGIAVMGIIYYFKFIVPIAKLKREHPEIFATNPPNAIVGGLSGTLLLLVILVVTGITIIMLRGKA